MKLKAKCRTHPKSDVLLLIGTVKYVKNGAGEYCDEHEEKAIGVELDEANTYCTSSIRNAHDIVFEVVPE